MNERRSDVSTPVTIRVPVEQKPSLRNGKVRIISTDGVYFTSDQNLTVGGEVDIKLTLPSEYKLRTPMFIRAVGKVLRLEKDRESERAGVDVAAVIELYDIIRNEADIA